MVYVKVKKWGNSLGITLPVDIVRNTGVVENEIIEIEIRKKNEPLKKLFGTLSRKIPAQQLKDEIRAGWEE
jgi:antitoxin component of MazEF toxin-antitoxin module